MLQRKRRDKQPASVERRQLSKAVTRVPKDLGPRRHGEKGRHHTGHGVLTHLSALTHYGGALTRLGVVC